MAVTPIYTLGRHLTSVVITPCTENATTGVITEVSGSAVTMTAVIDAISHSLRRSQEMIVPVNSTREHYENVMDGYSLRITEIQTRKNGTTFETQLPKLAAAYGLLKVVYVRGGNTITFYGRWDGIEDGITSAGKNTATITLTPVDTGGSVAPYTYA